MPRNLKALGLALVAVFAMSAMAASGAQALKLTAPEYPVVLTGHQIEGAGHAKFHVFSAEKVEVRCEEATFGATVTEQEALTLEEVNVTPEYSKCSVTLAGKTLPATVKMTHCWYRFHNGTKDTEHLFTPLTDLKCANAGEAPHVDIYETAAKHTENKTTCSLTPTPFTNKTGASATNNTTAELKDIDLTANVVGITTHRTGSILCGTAEQQATYKGLATVEGYKDGGSAPVIDEGSETTTLWTFSENGRQNVTIS